MILMTIIIIIIIILITMIPTHQKTWLDWEWRLLHTRVIGSMRHLLQQWVHFTPTAIEAGGSWNDLAIEFINDLGKKITAVSQEQ